jgi:hypothetical protein
VNDAEFEREKVRIVTLERRWFETLGLAAWKINTVFVRSDFTSDGAPSPNTVATASTLSEYMQATISWNLPQVVEQNDRDLERIFLHEVMHVILNEMRPSRQETDIEKVLRGEDLWHEERVATMLGNAFLWTREANRRYAPVEGEY